MSPSSEPNAAAQPQVEQGEVARDVVPFVDKRMVAVMRCILAVSAALTIYLHPMQPDRLLGLTYSSLILYCFYAVLLAGSVYRGRPIVPWRAQHWVDVLFYAFLLHLTF